MPNIFMMIPRTSIMRDSFVRFVKQRMRLIFHALIMLVFYVSALMRKWKSTWIFDTTSLKLKPGHSYLRSLINGWRDFTNVQHIQLKNKCHHYHLTWRIPQVAQNITKRQAEEFLVEYRDGLQIFKRGFLTRYTMIGKSQEAHFLLHRLKSSWGRT